MRVHQGGDACTASPTHVLPSLLVSEKPPPCKVVPGPLSHRSPVSDITLAFLWSEVQVPFSLPNHLLIAPDTRNSGNFLLFHQDSDLLLLLLCPPSYFINLRPSWDHLWMAPCTSLADLSLQSGFLPCSPLSLGSRRISFLISYVPSLNTPLMLPHSPRHKPCAIRVLTPNFAPTPSFLFVWSGTLSG